MDPEEEREIEAKVKKEQGAGLEAKKLYAEVTGGIPNERNNPDSNFDAVNANFAGGQGLKGSHRTNINTQTDMELGGIEDPGGLDPASDREFLENMKRNIKKQQH